MSGRPLGRGRLVARGGRRELHVPALQLLDAFTAPRDAERPAQIALDMKVVIWPR